MELIDSRSLNEIEVISDSSDDNCNHFKSIHDVYNFPMLNLNDHESPVINIQSTGVKDFPAKDYCTDALTDNSQTNSGASEIVCGSPSLLTGDIIKYKNGAVRTHSPYNMTFMGPNHHYYSDNMLQITPEHIDFNQSNNPVADQQLIRQESTLKNDTNPPSSQITSMCCSQDLFASLSGNISSFNDVKNNAVESSSVIVKDDRMLYHHPSSFQRADTDVPVRVRESVSITKPNVLEEIECDNSAATKYVKADSGHDSDNITSQLYLSTDINTDSDHSDTTSDMSSCDEKYNIRAVTVFSHCDNLLKNKCLNIKKRQHELMNKITCEQSIFPHQITEVHRECEQLQRMLLEINDSNKMERNILLANLKTSSSMKKQSNCQRCLLQLSSRQTDVLDMLRVQQNIKTRIKTLVEYNKKLRARESQTQGVKRKYKKSTRIKKARSSCIKQDEYTNNDSCLPESSTKCLLSRTKGRRIKSLDKLKTKTINNSSCNSDHLDHLPLSCRETQAYPCMTEHDASNLGNKGGAKNVKICQAPFLTNTRRKFITTQNNARLLSVNKIDIKMDAQTESLINTPRSITGACSTSLQRLTDVHRINKQAQLNYCNSVDLSTNLTQSNSSILPISNVRDHKQKDGFPNIISSKQNYKNRQDNTPSEKGQYKCNNSQSNYLVDLLSGCYVKLIDDKELLPLNKSLPSDFWTKPFNDIQIDDALWNSINIWE